MSTRSIVHIKDGRKTIATIYRQWGGYPTGMGEDIKRILNDGEVTIHNGYCGSNKAPRDFNGMWCLAPYLIGELKDKKIGNVYLLPPGSKEGAGEEYIYTLSCSNDELMFKVFSVYENKTLYNGPLKDFYGEIAEGATKLEAELS